MYDMLIIGGGLQGLFFAHALHSRGLIDSSRIAIADPNETLAAVWNARCLRVGMNMLRSPSSHNMDPDYRALRRFARREGYRSELHLQYPYARPSLELFNHQLRRIIDGDRLSRSHIRSHVVSIERRSGGFRSHTSDGTIDSRQLILATGPGGVNEPAFLKSRRSNDPRVLHLFAGTDAINSPASSAHDPHSCAASNGERILVIGGGISAWQAALRYEQLGAKRVTLASPHPIRESIFDSAPCYMGPKCGNEYRSLPIPDRLERLKAVRFPGTLPPELAEQARAACSRGDTVDTIEMVVSALRDEGGGIRAVATGGETTDVYDRVTAATGLTCDVPYQEFVSSLSEKLSLPLYESGHPALAEDLSWTPGLFIAGRAAELVIGPQAGNIVGAHLAFRRIRDSVVCAAG